MKKKKSSSVEIGLGELSDLENELNDLAENVNTKSLENTRSNLFNKDIDATEKNVKFQDKEQYNNQKGDDSINNNLGEFFVEKCVVKESRKLFSKSRKREKENKNFNFYTILKTSGSHPHCEFYKTENRICSSLLLRCRLLLIELLLT